MPWMLMVARPLIQVNVPTSGRARFFKMMNSTQPAFDQAPSAEMSRRARRLESAAWAAFFVWSGVAMLTGVPWGWFFVGVGVLTLAAQLARRQMDMNVEGFWVACGMVFLASGVWELFAIPWSLAPVLLILLGVALLWKAVRP